MRHNPLGPRDDPPAPGTAGDLAFLGIDMRAPTLVPPGFVNSAVNLRLVEGVYETRRGLFTPAWSRYLSDEFPYRASYLRNDSATWATDYATTYGAGTYTDPDGAAWIVRVAARALLFFRETEIGRIVPFEAGFTVAGPCLLYQNFGSLIVVRGNDATSLVWEGNWATRVGELVPASVSGGHAAMPGGTYGLAWRERSVLLSGADELILSRIAAPDEYNTTSGIFYVNRGRGDVLRAAVPLGSSSLLLLKSQSLHVFTALQADLSDARLDVHPIDLQFDSPRTAIAADGRVWWLDRRGIRTARIAQIDADNKIILQVDVISDGLAPLLRRIAWRYAAQFSAAVTDERIYFAVALDTQTAPQSLIVWNRRLAQWESVDEWDTATLAAFDVLGFASGIPWLNESRLFAISSGGYVAALEYGLGEDHVGWSGTTPLRAGIADTLTTRAYTAGTYEPKRFLAAHVQLDTWNPGTLALAALFDGPAEETSLAGVTRSRTAFFTSATAFVPNNADGRYHDERRQDYSTALGSATPASGYSLWAVGATYTTGNQVHRATNGRNYTALGASTGTIGNEPGSDAGEALWAYLGVTTSLDTWTGSTAYVPDDEVIYRGGRYRCLQTHTSAFSTAPESSPQLWTDNGLDTALQTGGLFLRQQLGAYHSADVDRDGRIEDPEVNRVIELYNYRSGMTRTGEYQQLASAYSGYAPGPGSITTYHSADVDQNGRIDLSELTRVIELHNAGAYHDDATGADGFATGQAAGDGVRLEDFQTALERRSIRREALWCQLRISGTQGARKIRSIGLDVQFGSQNHHRHD